MPALDYSKMNHCNKCRLQYPKKQLRCTNCNQKLRTKRRNKK